MESMLTKLLLSFILIITLPALTNAQVQKGDNIIGFSTSVSTQSASPSNINVVVLFVYERYLSQKLSLGAGPFVNMITARGSITGVFGGNVFANYGFLTGDGKLYPYVGLVLSVSQSISTTDTRLDQNNTAGTTVQSGNSTVSFYGAGAKAGTKYFISERINLDVNVNYSTNISSIVNGENIDIGTGGIIQVFAGVGIIIGKAGTD